MEHDLECAHDRIRLLEISLGEYLDENVKSKNENKIFQKRLKAMTEDNEQTTKSGEVQVLREELNKFISHVSEQLADLKAKTATSAKSRQNQNPQSKCHLASVNRFNSLRSHINSMEKEEISSDGTSNADVDTPSPRTRSRRRRRRARKLKMVPGLDTYSQVVSGVKNPLYSRQV